MNPGRLKYGNQPTEVDGIRFASKAEARRYSELRLLEKGGVISALVLQPRFPLDVQGHRIGHYIADFSYTDRNGHLVVEDVKGMLTQVYKLKKRLVKAIYGIDIVEVN